MFKISKEESIQIAKKYLSEVGFSVPILSVSSHISKHYNVWAVGFALDTEIEPSFIFVYVDPITGEPFTISQI